MGWSSTICFHIFEKGVNKIKNDKVRTVLNSDLANAAINYGLDYAKNKFHKY